MRFGRKPRAHDPRVALLSSLKRLRAPPALPPSVDYTAVLPGSLGMFGNDFLGDCTCAAVYHALQVWSANANPPIDTEPDNNAILLYEQSCGYNPADPSTDQGGVEQSVLAYWMNPGAPTGPAANLRQQLAAFVEIDQRNLDTVKQAIYEGGLVYIGFLVPAFFNTSAAVWDVDPSGDNSIVDGHAVVLCGFNDATQRFKLISWGRIFEMIYAFFSQFCDECYLLANRLWIESTGNTPLGMSLAELEAAMQALQFTPGPWSRPRRRRRRRSKRWKGKKPPAAMQP